MKDDKLYLIHIGECIERIQKFTSKGKSDFFDDFKTQDAVLRNLQILAESTQHLSSQLKSQYPGIDWKSIAGLRNVLVHDYLGISMSRIWEIVETQLPILNNQIQVILKEI